MARPRVIIASDDAKTAVRMVKSLNPRRYRVEHIFDLSEAILRAELVLAHALVIHASTMDPDIMRRCGRRSDRVAWIFVSASPEVDAAARKVGARFVSDPFEVDDFRRAVFRSVAHTHDRRSNPSPPSNAGISVVQHRVALLAADVDNAQVIAAVIRKELSVSCQVVGTASAALALIDDTLDCVIAEPRLLVAGDNGPALASALARSGIPVVALTGDQTRDVSTAGQAAWHIVPQLRRSLAAREQRAEAPET